jgi:S-adenosylmethionine:tRNA ribosyltransferase-isomerase
MAQSFPVAELDYDLPRELIAQVPLPERGASRLLIVDRQADRPMDAVFGDLPRHLHSGDLLVFNDTRVVPAKFLLRRQTGGRLDGLFLRELAPGEWEVLLNGAGRLKPDESLVVEPETDGAELRVAARLGGGRWRVRVCPSEPAAALLERVGQAPLPPYISRARQPEPAVAARDRSRYQTVYATRPGAVAAPTAGLHFTERVLDDLRRRGVETASVTLHVGLGTFAPVKVDDLRDHRMHPEWCELPSEMAAAVARCRRGGGRVVAVGTTSLRVLESKAAGDGLVNSGADWTGLFCYPPYDFRVVDALLTNFHLPRSTLLALVMAFAGVERTRAAYRHAVEARYRFFSYGDAMLIR